MGAMCSVVGDVTKWSKKKKKKFALSNEKVELL
jgi:hypothetical protein